MSRKASLAGSRPAAVTSLSTTGSADDICPVCKTIRYLNKEMVFLINAECYHPMCSNCVSRLFAGPNQCPYAGCHKTLRRRDFHRAFFEDLGVEREVDIRKRVAAVFNKVEDDFEDLGAYNAYLEDVETLTMDLVGGESAVKRAAEAKLQLYEAEHRAEIEKNKRKSERADDASRKRLAAEQAAARRKRLEALEQDQEERLRKAREREEDLDSLTKAPEGTAGRVMLKRRGQHQKEDMLKMEEDELRRAAGGGLSIRGLKDKKRAAVVDGPYDPFGGLNLQGSRYTVQDAYRDPRVHEVETRDEFTVPGYSLHEYYSRVMFDAFAGLGVFIDDEKETGPGTTAASVATLGASMAADSGRTAPVKMEVDDVF